MSNKSKKGFGDTSEKLTIPMISRNDSIDSNILSEKLANIQNSILTLNLENSNLAKSKISELKKKNRYLYSQMDMFRKKCEFLEKNRLELEKFLKENMEESEVSSIRAPSTCPSEILSFINSGKSRFQEIFEENSKLRQQLDMMRENQTKFDSEMQRKVESLQEVQLKNEILEQKLKNFSENRLIDENAKLRKELASSKSSNQNLLLELSDLTNKINELNEKSSIGQEQIKFLEEQNSGLKYEIDQMELEMEKQMQTVEEQKGLNAKFDEIATKVTNFQILLKEKDNRICELNVEVCRLSKVGGEHFEVLIRKLREDKTELFTQLKDLNGKLKDFEEKSKIQEKIIFEKESEVRQLQLTVENLQAEKEVINQKFNLIQARKSCRDESSGSSSSSKSSGRSSSKYIEEIEELKSQLQTAKIQNGNLENRNKMLNFEKEKLVKDFQRKLNYFESSLKNHWQNNNSEDDE